MYLILDKQNKVVAEKKALEEAEGYVVKRPYLRFVEFHHEENYSKCDLDEIFN